MYRFVDCTDCSKDIATDEIGTRFVKMENGFYAILCFDCYMVRTKTNV